MKFPNRHIWAKRVQRIIGRTHAKLNAIVLPHFRAQKAKSDAEWSEVLSAIEGAIDEGYGEARDAGIAAARAYGIKLTDAQLGSINAAAEEAVARARTYVRANLAPFLDEKLDNLNDGTVDAEAATDAVANRLELYAEPAWNVFQTTRGEAMDYQAGLLFVWSLDPASNHCDDCPDLADEGPYTTSDGDNPIPTWPGDGDTCIVTPHSRVLTARGWVGIANVHVGDMVLTGRGRWRQVTATPRTPSAQGRAFAVIRPSSRHEIICTADHRWLTDVGWQRAEMAATSRRSIRGLTQRSRMVSLAMDMGESERADTARLSHSPCESQLRGRPHREFTNAVAIRASGGSSHDRTTFSGNGREARRSVAREEAQMEMHHLWSGLRVLRTVRRKSEPSILLSKVLPGSSTRGKIRRHPAKNNGAMDLPILRHPVLQQAALVEWEDQRPEILLGGVLQPGTTLYDLTVEEDCSFLVEGLVAHNSCGARCNCDVTPEETSWNEVMEPIREQSEQEADDAAASWT